MVAVESKERVTERLVIALRNVEILYCGITRGSDKDYDQLVDDGFRNITFSLVGPDSMRRRADRQ